MRTNLECGPSDRHELELIQGDILERLQYLREKGYSLKEDLTLEHLYLRNSEIQNCILTDYSFDPITIGVLLGLGIAVCLSYYFRIWKKRQKF